MNTKMKINGDKTIKHANIKAKLGLTDKKNHSVFYLEGGTFITPEIEFDDFTEIMRNIESSCKTSIKKKLFKTPIFDSNFLMNFEVCSERMKVGKNSYLSFQYHFKQKNNENQSIIDIKQEHERFFIELLNEIEERLHAHNIQLNQKRKYNN